MLYQVLKIYVRLMMPLYCHRLTVNHRNLLKTPGPLLIASNHPNSFLDAILYDILFEVPVTALARGDAFKNKKIFRVLKHLKMLPVYRIREGAQHLNANYDTFDDCLKIFKRREAVLIFSEGLCVNEWHLRPLKKGTARLAFQAWDAGLPLRVLPAALNYSAFGKLGKHVIINLGNEIQATAFSDSHTDGQRYQQFNRQLEAELSKLVHVLHSGQPSEFDKVFGTTPRWQQWILAVPAAIGALIHYPLYGMARAIIQLRFAQSDHLDSIQFGILLLGYPFYLLLAAFLCYYLGCPVWWATFLLLPFTAWAYTHFKIRKGTSH